MLFLILVSVYLHCHLSLNNVHCVFCGLMEFKFLHLKMLIGLILVYASLGLLIWIDLNISLFLEFRTSISHGCSIFFLVYFGKLVVAYYYYCYFIFERIREDLRLKA